MVLKLVGVGTATCTQRVMLIAHELGVPFELVNIDFAKLDHKAPAYVAVQPFGQTPYLDDDGFKMYESRAICRYLALKYGGVAKGLIPDPASKDLHKTALFEQAASTEVCNFDPSVSGLAYENIFYPMHGRATNPAAVEAHKATLEGKLTAYDVILGRSRFIAGNEITIADLFHVPYGSLLAKQNIDWLESGKYPNVTRWWTEITSRESWKKVIAQ